MVCWWFRIKRPAIATMSVDAFFKSFLPQAGAASFAEKVRSGLAGGMAILLLSATLHYLPQHAYPLLMLASMAASAVLLFAAPHSPFSQPWNLVGGHAVSAIAGWVCCLYVPDAMMAAGMAVGSAIFLMYVLKCLHPPGAATALTIVLNGAQFSSMGWQWVAGIVLVNAGLMLLLALLINNMLPGRAYPAGISAHNSAKPEPKIIPQQADFEWAMTQMEGVIDVSVEDLAEIYRIAQNQANDRYAASLRKS